MSRLRLLKITVPLAGQAGIRVRAQNGHKMRGCFEKQFASGFLFFAIFVILLG
jgi:hypothetical protein